MTRWRRGKYSGQSIKEVVVEELPYEWIQNWKKSSPDVDVQYWLKYFEEDHMTGNDATIR
jgi:hypothetical protein